MIIEPQVDFAKYGEDTLEYGFNYKYTTSLEGDRLKETDMTVRANTLQLFDSIFYQNNPDVYNFIDTNPRIVQKI